MDNKLAGIIAAARLRALRTETSPARAAAGAILDSEWLRDLLREAKAEAWEQGCRSGYSNAMRRMSDEPEAPAYPNPYRD